MKTSDSAGLDVKRFNAGLGLGVAAEFEQIIVGFEGQFGLVYIQKLGNPKNQNFSINLGYNNLY